MPIWVISSKEDMSARLIYPLLTFEISLQIIPFVG